ADLFVLVSYTSMVWFEYTTNPRMRTAVQEIGSAMDAIAYSQNTPRPLRERYAQAKEYVRAKMPVKLAAGCSKVHGS
ncbi:uncharacterized protein NEMAJ01_1810, partial [Nematocida major]|uniref:uncharacterized protein n=1 Tax=Nematocida major TaxID=1912982 RepID=UPI0020080A48